MLFLRYGRDEKKNPIFFVFVGRESNDITNRSNDIGRVFGYQNVITSIQGTKLELPVMAIIKARWSSWCAITKL